MNHEDAVRITVKVTCLTVKHMCEVSGKSIDEVVSAILAGGAARKRFDEYMKLAAKELA